MADSAPKYRVTGAYIAFRRHGVYLDAYRGSVVTIDGVPPETVAHLQAMQLITPIDPDLED